jgi:hypothetical protein
MTAPKTATPAAAPKSPAAPAAAKARKARPTVPENETPEQRFRRLGSVRLTKAVAMLRRLETVAKAPGYSYTPEQAATAMKHLDAAVDAVRHAFVNRVAGRKEDQKIQL